jgi:hypothetical protein
LGDGDLIGFENILSWNEALRCFYTLFAVEGSTMTKGSWSKFCLPFSPKRFLGMLALIPTREV